jgi:hypothetical protein
MSTVFTTMKRCVDMTKAMGQVHSGICWGWFAGKRIGMSRIFLEIECRRSQRMSAVLERLLEHSVILSNAFSILPGTPLVLGLLNAKQAVKDDALLLICTDLSCNLFFFDWLILGSTA